MPDFDAFQLRPGVKWARAEPGVLAAWVADMDFPIPPPVRAALVHRIDSDLGYPVWTGTGEGTPLGVAFAERMTRLFGFTPDPSYVREFSDINQALQVLLHLVTEPGDGVALHTPAYPSFLATLAEMKRPATPIPLAAGGDNRGFDLDRIDDEIARHRCRVLLLVNPHNPTGRVFRREELTELAELALTRGLLVIADEIHCDLVYEPHRHVPFASLGADVAARTVTLTAATKAFNLAGIRCSIAHVGPRSVRQALDAQPKHLFGEVNVLGVEATLAAWREGDDWLAKTLAVLDRNRRRLADTLPPGVGYHLPEATYLAWLDCRALGLAADPAEFFHENARVMLSGGSLFGPGGAGFARLNFATTEPVLDEIVRRMRHAVHQHIHTPAFAPGLI